MEEQTEPPFHQCENENRITAVNAHKWGVWWNERAGGFIVQEYGQTVGHIGKGKTWTEAVDDAIAHND